MRPLCFQGVGATCVFVMGNPARSPNALTSGRIGVPRGRHELAGPSRFSLSRAATIAGTSVPVARDARAFSGDPLLGAERQGWEFDCAHDRFKAVVLGVWTMRRSRRVNGSNLVPLPS